MPARWVLASSLLWGCGTTSGPGRDIQDLDESGAERCEFVEDISETEYTGSRISGPGLEGVRAKVRNRAAKVGATHVVWETLAASSSLQAASARAYRCPAPGGAE
jgi:predicted small secreted protein